MQIKPGKENLWSKNLFRYGQEFDLEKPALRRRGYSLTACNAAPLSKSKMTSRWDPNWQTRSGKGSNPRFVCAPLNFHQICFLIGEAVTSKNVVTENCLRILDQIQNLFKLRTYGMVQKNNENSGLLSLLRVNCLNADRLQRQLLVPITQICTQKSRSNPPQALKIHNQTRRAKCRTRVCHIRI